jgi:hypothetical protein
METVEVTHTPGDIYAVTFQSWRRLVLRVVILFGILIAIFISLPIIIDGQSLRESVRWFPWDIYLGLIAFLLLFLFGAGPLIAYFRAKRQGALGPNVLALSDDGVRFEGPKGESLIYWHAFTRFVATRSRFLLFIGPANALVLPKRAFADQMSFEAFGHETERRWRAARCEGD